MSYTNNDFDKIDVYGTLIRETDKAIYIEVGDERVWLPKSQIEFFVTDTLTRVVLPQWLAVQRGLV